jgi:hypothetical protein
MLKSRGDYPSFDAAALADGPPQTGKATYPVFAEGVMLSKCVHEAKQRQHMENVERESRSIEGAE